MNREKEIKSKKSRKYYEFTCSAWQSPESIRDLATLSRGSNPSPGANKFPLCHNFVVHIAERVQPLSTI